MLLYIKDFVNNVQAKTRDYKMARSRNAKVVSEVLELFSMYTEKNGEKLIEDAISNGEKPTPPPKKMETRYEDLPNGSVCSMPTRTANPGSP